MGIRRNRSRLRCPLLALSGHAPSSDQCRFRGHSGQACAAYGVTSSTIRDFTNGRGSDVDGPIRHAKLDRRMHTREVPHTRAVPHRADIHQPPLAAAL